MFARVAAVTALAVCLAAAAWYLVRPADEGAAVRQRLEAFAADVNRSTTDNVEPGARAARLGAYFTEDIEVDFGQGAAPIKGRATIIDMAARLQPRTAAFSLKFEDISVAMAPGGEGADVHLTAEFIRQSMTTGEESLDAREFTIGMRRVGGDWKIARITAVETLK
jgi:hypothetical protein